MSNGVFCSVCKRDHGPCFVCDKATEAEQKASRERGTRFRRYINDPSSRMADGSEIPPDVRAIMQAFAGEEPS